MKIASIVGTRPNFIKLLPLAPKILEKFEHIVIHTGQHYDYEMDKTFFDSLPLPKVDYHLTLDEKWSEIHKLSEMIKQLELIILQVKPDVVLVYGDVNSTLAGAITTSKLQIPIGHIEAGIRLYGGKQPEELIRKLVDNCSNLLFCPTELALKNLKEEKVTGESFFVGDTMYDAFLQNAPLLKKNDILSQLGLKHKNYYLVTIHRAENTDDKTKLTLLTDILSELNEITIFPCHPRTEKMLKQFNLWEKCKQSKNLRIVPPLNYLNFLNLLVNTKKVLTDSGGVQREAYFAKVPCIILSSYNLWPEIVQNGGGILTHTKKMILDAIHNFNGVGTVTGFGDGHACEKIVEILDRH